MEATESVSQEDIAATLSEDLTKAGESKTEEDELTESFINATYGEPEEAQPKRRRGRPRKTEQTTLNVEDATANPKSVPIDNDEPEPTPRTRRRRGAINGDQVTNLTVSTFHIIALMRQKAYWNVHPLECAEWAQAAADLINDMNPKVAKQLAKGYNGTVVVMGLGSILYARLAQETLDKKQAAQFMHTQEQASQQANDPFNSQATMDDYMREAVEAAMNAAQNGMAK